MGIGRPPVNVRWASAAPVAVRVTGDAITMA